MTDLIIDPPIGRGGFNLLLRARRFDRENGRAYPLAFESDKRGATAAVAGGYLQRQPDDSHFVRLTPKGEAYLDKLMRCE